MRVVATAGHVDHGKSTLVKALTGSDPDRLSEEHRRGLSIELGYCWTDLPGAGTVAFVDVPGHERFLPTMLAGVGPVPAVLLVVAADDPWMPQTAEHLAAIDAFGVRHGVVAISRSDLVDPEAARQLARDAISHTTLAGAPVVAVSATTGQGMTDLVGALVAMTSAMEEPEATADVRLWIDRRFHVKGAGTVVTGTLPAGRIKAGDQLSTGAHAVRVRGVQSLGREQPEVTGTARVALNLGGEVPASLDRGSVLVKPDAFVFSSVVDVRIDPADHVPERPLLHIGAAAVGTHQRPLGSDTSRISLDRPLPLRIGDRALLRDPGSRRLWGVTVLDPQPPALRRRGAAARRGAELATASGQPDVAAEVRRRGLVSTSTLRRLGVHLETQPTGDSGIRSAGDWLIDERRVDTLTAQLAAAVEQHDSHHPLDPGLPVAAAVRKLGLPAAELLTVVLPADCRVEAGRVTRHPADEVPQAVTEAVAALTADLAERPFAAPDAARLAEVGLDAKAAAAAARAGLLLRLADGVVLLPGADRLAVSRLLDLPQPFTASEARRALDTSRRVALPLLAHLDRVGLTRRLADDRRTVAQPTPRAAAMDTP